MVSQKSLAAIPIPILSGATASGKTSLVLALAEEQPDIEVINADSMLVYRGMDIGTAKPTPEERHKVVHHLIDIRDADQAFTAGDFVREAEAAVSNIVARGKRPILVGGSGFYLKALLYGLWQAPPANPEARARLDQLTGPDLYQRLASLDEKAALRIGAHDRYRLVRALEIFEATGQTPSLLETQVSRQADPRYQLLVLDRPNPELYQRIALRTRQMLEQGLIAEVERLLHRYPEARSLGAVGYAQVRDHLQGRTPAGRKLKPGLEGLREEIELATRQLVKRQRTWFRAEKSAHWFTLEEDREAVMRKIRSR